ncbi:MAG: VOC family protein [Bacteroidetes bacterium]|nr:VOC family protein [Bacteroidota bacterium]
MGAIKQKITNCLWYDSEAEQAAAHYVSIFPNSHIGAVTRYGKEGFEFHKKAEGSVMTVTFFLDRQEFLGLNGGPLFKFNEAMSLMVSCNSQEEIDHYWYKLSDDGEESQCGWLKDKFGVSWQIISEDWISMINDPDKEKVKRVTTALFTMSKPELAVLKRAFDGK